MKRLLGLLMLPVIAVTMAFTVPAFAQEKKEEKKEEKAKKKKKDDKKEEKK